MGSLRFYGGYPCYNKKEKRTLSRVEGLLLFAAIGAAIAALLF